MRSFPEPKFWTWFPNASQLTTSEKGLLINGCQGDKNEWIYAPFIDFIKRLNDQNNLKQIRKDTQ